MTKNAYSFDYKVPQEQIVQILDNLETYITIQVNCVGHIQNGEPKVKITGLAFIDHDIVYLKDNLATVGAIQAQSITEFNNRFNNAKPIEMNVVQMAEEYSITNLTPQQKHLN